MSEKKDIAAIHIARGSAECAYIEKKPFRREYVLYRGNGKEIYRVSGDKNDLKVERIK